MSLTDDELDVIDRLGRIWNDLRRVVDNGPTRSPDLDELIGHIHALQRAVMANSAARAHPGRLRTLGGTTVVVHPRSEAPPFQSVVDPR